MICCAGRQNSFRVHRCLLAMQLMAFQFLGGGDSAIACRSTAENIINSIEFWEDTGSLLIAESGGKERLR